MYQCFHCLSDSVVWSADFSFEDYGYEMENDEGQVTTEGVVHVCRCTNCGAEIEYKVPIFENL